MNSEFFTDPPACVQQARIAMARAETRIALDFGPLVPECNTTGIGMAFMNLEDVYPPYPPLLDIDPSPDPRADIAVAIRLLGQATAEADRVADIVRYAATICDLYDLDLLADEVDPGTGGWSGQWP